MSSGLDPARCEKADPVRGSSSPSWLLEPALLCPPPKPGDPERDAELPGPLRKVSMLSTLCELGCLLCCRVWLSCVLSAMLPASLSRPMRSLSALLARSLVPSARTKPTSA